MIGERTTTRRSETRALTLKPVERVVVVGGPGSGKSTLARRVSAAVGAEHIELDSLWWKSEWVPSDPVEFAGKLRNRLLGSTRWVVDGNYLDSVGVAEVWRAADTIVWLDLPRPTACRRTIQRSARRVLTRQRLWNGNREDLSVLTPRSLKGLWSSWPGYGDRIRVLIHEPDLNHLVIICLRSSREVRNFLRTLRVG